MLSELNILSIVFFIASLAYTIIGFYSFSLNKEKRENQIFFVICLCLAEWSMCFALSTGADPSNLRTALLFRKLGVFGWGIFYSLGFCFLQLLMYPEKKRPIYEYVLIYIPALLNIIFYTCLGDISNAQFAMVYTKNGWISDDVNTAINTYYLFYALIFSSITIIKSLRWQYDPNNPRSTRKARLLSLLYLLAFLLSLFTEVILNKIFDYKLPQLTIVWLVMPVFVMFYILLKKKVIAPSFDTNVYQIIDERKEENIFNITGYIYVLFAYTTLFYNYLIPAHRLPDQILWSFIIYTVGAIHFFIKHFFKKTTNQYNLITLISIVMLTVVSIRFKIEGFSVIWGLFFYYLIITAIFDKNIYTYFIVIAIVIIEIFMWYKNPVSYNLVVDWTEYSRRIIMSGTSLFIVLYINKLYKTKIKENMDQLEMQKALSIISKDLLEVNIENLDSKISHILKLCNEYFNYSSSYYYKYKDTDKNFRQICHTDYEKDENSEIIFNALPHQEAILKKEAVLITKIQKEKNLPENIRQYFTDKNIVGFYAIPVVIENEVKGCVVFEFKDNRQNMAIADSNKIISNLIASTIKKVNYEKILYYNANYDILTGLKNRNGFKKDVAKILETENLVMPAVVFLSIDNFKVISNAFGHAIGDDVLKKVSEILTMNSDKSTVFARFNKEEFCLFYPNTESKEEIQYRLTTLLMLFEKPITIPQYEFKLYFNIGVSIFPDDGQDIHNLLKNADLAMTEAKKMGKMKIHLCDSNDKKTTIENALYTTKLFTALKNNEWRLAYQPQIDCQTGKMIGAEALLRWDSPEFGIVSPGKFIPILEHTGLIIRVGEWIIDQVAMQQVKMAAKGLPKIRLSANLSVIQFQDEKLIDKLQNILDNWVIDTDYFELEITENVATSNDKFLFERFSEIKELGCSIAIDDFGVEFSSLNRLQALPIDRLKIDKSFVDGIGKDKKKEAIIKIIIQMAEALGLDSIAEGVEDEEQLNFLKENHCKEIQGYYFAKPMFEEEFIEFVKTHA